MNWRQNELTDYVLSNFTTYAQVREEYQSLLILSELKRKTGTININYASLGTDFNWKWVAVMRICRSTVLLAVLAVGEIWISDELGRSFNWNISRGVATASVLHDAGQTEQRSHTQQDAIRRPNVWVFCDGYSSLAIIVLSIFVIRIRYVPVNILLFWLPPALVTRACTIHESFSQLPSKNTAYSWFYILSEILSLINTIAYGIQRASLSISYLLVVGALYQPNLSTMMGRA